MGKSFSKQETKIESDSDADATVELQEIENSHSSIDADDLKDPRSPHPYSLCRTPINEFSELRSAKLQENPSNSFKKRLLRTLKINPFDPRSPSNIINRTPIAFDAAASNVDNSLSLNDTFSDLFIESHASDSFDEQLSKIEPATEISIEKAEEVPIEKSEEEISIEKSEEVDLSDGVSCSDTSLKGDIINSDQILNGRDPRSPSVEVNRTPIVFEDDESRNNDPEKSNSIIIESNESSNNELLDPIKFSEEKPKHKLVERVKNPPKRKTRSSSRLAAKNYKLRINNENISYSKKHVLSSTPKRNAIQLNEKRTPLGCVANKSHLRPKSNENSTKMFFTRSPGVNTKSFNENQNELEA